MIDTTIHDVERIEITEPEKHYLSENNKNPYYTRRIQIFDKRGTRLNFTLFSYTKDELKLKEIS